MIFHSIRWSIQAWHGALLVIVVTGFGITAYRLASADRLRQVDELLQADLSQLAVALPPSVDDRTLSRPPVNRPPPPPREAGNSDALVPADHYYIVWRPDGSEQARSANAPTGIQKPDSIQKQGFGVRSHGTEREVYRLTGVGRCFLVGRSVEKDLAELRRLAWYLAAAGAAVLGLGLAGGWLAASRAIRPIAEISATAERIASGDLSQRVAGADVGNELGRLAGVLNSTFSRLEAAFTQQARFTADAAHELRTPVAVMLTYTHNGLACDDLAEEPREAFEACERAAQRMRGLIESLLELARLDAGQERMKDGQLDLAILAQEVVQLVAPLAEKRSISISTDLESAPCRGDAERLAQVVINLLTNAIEHNREGGEVRIETRILAGCASLSVADSGRGIAATDLPHVFERFYRADAARSGARRHTGLGLAISKAIVDAHGGRLIAESPAGGGAVFSLQISSHSLDTV